MSRTVALIAALCILELGICTSQSISKNISDATDVPANSESISESADAESQAKHVQPKTIASKPDAGSADDVAVPPVAPPAGKMVLKSATPKYDDGSDSTDAAAAKPKVS